MADLGQYGSYPDDWGPHEIDFFNSEPQTFREFYTEEEWEDLQDAFAYGWIYFRDENDRKISKGEHEQARQRFYDITGTQESSFDWDGYREYLSHIETT